MTSKNRISNVLIVSCLAFVGCSGEKPEKEMVKAERAIKAGISQDFYDPSAVQYRKEIMYGGEGSYMLCGEYNGKNKYGSYTGFRQFFGSAEKVNEQYVYSFGYDEKESEFHDKYWLFCSTSKKVATE